MPSEGFKRSWNWCPFYPEHFPRSSLQKDLCSMNFSESFHLLVKWSNFVIAWVFIFCLNNPKCCEINWVKKKSYSECHWPKARLLNRSSTLQDGNILIRMTKLNCTQEWGYFSPTKWFLDQQFCRFTALRNNNNNKNLTAFYAYRLTYFENPSMILLQQS